MTTTRTRAEALRDLESTSEINRKVEEWRAVLINEASNIDERVEHYRSKLNVQYEERKVLLLQEENDYIDRIAKRAIELMKD
jgi:hypothetical protein